MTLRDALIVAHYDKVFKRINRRDRQCSPRGEEPSLADTADAYGKVVLELLNNPKTKPYFLHWIVRWATDSYEHKRYIKVSLFNTRYVAPPKGTRPWGGSNPPKGYYNCNSEKHHQFMAAGFTPWSKLIDTPVIVKLKKWSVEQVVAEILWEITFYGWSEKSAMKMKDSILKESRKVIKDLKSKKSKRPKK